MVTSRVEGEHGLLVAAQQQRGRQAARQQVQPGQVERGRHGALARDGQREHDERRVARVLQQQLARAQLPVRLPREHSSVGRAARQGEGRGAPCP